MQLNSTFSHIFAILIFCGWMACGKSKKNSTSGVAEDSWHSNPPTLLPEAKEGIFFVIHGMDSPQQSIEMQVSQKELSFHPQVGQVVPGFHWPWVADFPKIFKWSATQGKWMVWKPVPEVLPPGTALKFQMSLDSSLQDHPWPTVTGQKNDRLATLTPQAFLSWTWKETQTPVHWIVPGYSPRSRGKSCGLDCVEFENVAHFMDSPVTWLPQGREEAVLTKKNFTVTLGAGTWGSDAWKARFQDTAFWDTLDGLRGQLKEKAFDPQDGSNYLIHLVANRRCLQQGLEHFEGTLISDDLDCPKSSSLGDFFGLLTHEILHTWLGKWIAPGNSGQVQWQEFNSSRLEYAFLYEGVTEGLSQLLTAQSPYGDKTSQTSHWSQTFEGMERAVGLALPELSKQNPGWAYQYGAAFALDLSLAIQSDSKLDSKDSVLVLLQWLRELFLVQGTTLDSLNKPFLRYLKFEPFQWAFSPGAKSLDWEGIRHATSQVLAGPALESFSKRWLRETQPVFSNREDWQNWCQDTAKAMGGHWDPEAAQIKY